MPSSRFKPRTIRKIRLGLALQDLREQAGLTQRTVTEQLGYDKSWISRIESGDIGAKPQRVAALLRLYRVPQGSETWEHLLTEAQLADQPGWWDQLDHDLSTTYLSYISLESEASLVCNFELVLVPGLLQTEDYARAVVRADLRVPDTQVEQVVAVRMARRQVLDREPPLQLWAIISEAVLRSKVGAPHPDVMREQLEHLLVMAERSNITLQVLPLDVGAHPAMTGSFVVMTFSDPDSEELHMAYVESLGGEQLESPDPGGVQRMVRHLKLVWRGLQEAALVPAESMALVRQIADSL